MGMLPKCYSNGSGLVRGVLLRCVTGSAVESRPGPGGDVMSQKKMLSVQDAVQYQRDEYGRVVYGRDALRAAVRGNLLPVVRVGVRRVYIPASALDRLLQGRGGEEVA